MQQYALKLRQQFLQKCSRFQFGIWSALLANSKHCIYFSAVYHQSLGTSWWFDTLIALYWYCVRIFGTSDFIGSPKIVMGQKNTFPVEVQHKGNSESELFDCFPQFGLFDFPLLSLTCTLWSALIRVGGQSYLSSHRCP